jgi:YVTN family beta-propeller protein
VTNKVYVANNNSNYVTVIDGATNSTTTVGAGGYPNAVAVNPVTNKIYVAIGSDSGTVTVIDGATNSTTTLTDPNAIGPTAVAVNPVTNKIYVANQGTGPTGQPSTVTVIDGATNTIQSVSVGSDPISVAVNPVTNKIYVSNHYANAEAGTSSTVTVIDGATNATQTVTLGPGGECLGAGILAVNPVTNKIYVPCSIYDSSFVAVIDGTTNAVQIFCCTGVEPYAAAVNPVTNKIYVPGVNSLYYGVVTVIDGATLTAETVVAVYGVGYSPMAVAVNPVTNKIYVPNWDDTVTVITEQQVQPIPLVTAIAPLTDNQTISPTPTFDFTATSSFSPTAPTPQAVWYQLDTWQGPWLPASGAAPNFSGTTPSLPLGTHILYAFATDGQDANSTGMEQQLIGSMAAYLFEVVPASTTTALTSAPNPSYLGESVTFTATVTVTPPGSGTPTGTVTFFDGTITLGSVALTSSGQAVYTTSVLSVGGHSITATYSGAPNYLGSTSNVLAQQVNLATVATLSPTSLNFGKLVYGTQSAPKSVKLTNPGSIPLDIININPGETGMFKISANTCGATLAPGKYCWISVVFAPNEPNPTDEDVLSVYDDAANSPQTASLLGTVVAQTTWSPASLTFATQAVGTTSAAKIVTLTNNLTTALSISSIGFTGTDPGDFFVQTQTCVDGVAAKAKCTISVTFTPQATGSRTATLSVSDSASNSPQTVPLKGTGIVPVTLTPAGFIYYPKQKVGTTSAAKTFTVTNLQNVALTGIAITTYAPFAVSATTCTTSLPAKGKCTISVTFTPEAAESYEAALFVYDSASNSPQTSIMLGTGK